MDFSQDYFALFGLPRRHALDEAALGRAYHEIQARVHPDKHVNLSDAEQRLAMQWTTRINEAYQVLRQPLSRAKYLLALAGIDVDRGREMSGEFLTRQMDRRETVAEARAARDVGRLEDLHDQLRRDLGQEYELLAQELEGASEPGFSRAPQAAAATGLLRQLMFQEKLLHDIDDALAAAEA